MKTSLHRFPPFLCLESMKRILLVIDVIIAIAIMASCEENGNMSVDSETFKIELIFTCGWCAGSEILKLSDSKYTYEYDYACGDLEDVPETAFNLTEKEWTSLAKNIDISAFKNLEIDNCGVCYDGCDFVLKMSDSTFSHQIRFVNSEEITDNKTQQLAQELITLLEFKREELQD